MTEHALSPRIRSLLTARGIIDEAAIATFLSPDYARDCHDPLLLHDARKAAIRILQAIDARERIAVYADFDCDGIPAAVVMHDLFSLLKYDAVEFYIPDRDTEGFGFHQHAVDLLKTRGVSVIITVDVGAAASETVAHAQALGIDVIVTDHHEFLELPPAFACVHPRIAPYPFPHLCGAGVAFKYAQSVLCIGKEMGHACCTQLKDGIEKWMLDMVALATVADMVPLVNENRCLVHFGLQVMRKSRRPGMRALAKVARVQQSYLTEDDIGFAIAPRINAASRMSSPHLAFRLFTTKDEVEAETLARELDTLNTKRKALTASITKQVLARVQSMDLIPPVIVLGSSEYKPALLGSVATSLVQTYKRPVCLWGREQTGVLKGSARTDGSVSVITLLQGAGDVMLHSGGHEGAGGFAINEEQLHTLETSLCASYIQHARVSGTSEITGEVLHLHEVTEHLLRELDLLRPFGEGNPKPLWKIHGRAESIRPFGKDMNHTEIMLSHESGKTLRTYRFFSSPEQLGITALAQTMIAVVGTIEKNMFKRGAVEIRISSLSE